MQTSTSTSTSMMQDLGYAGDMTPQQTFDLLSDSNSNAVVLDVRTDAEREWVGWPVLPNGHTVRIVQWLTFPGMVRNPDFLAQVKEAIPDLSTTVIVLCRSGVRSIPAAKLLAQEGYSRAYNLAGGFEGDKNGNGHRANVNGWKVAGLPWQQK